MTQQIEMPEETLIPRGVGPQLRLAREKMGLTVKDLAERTRIAQRYIVDIENGRFSALPGNTYAMGFARSLAREVELDQDDVAAMVRAEIAANGTEVRERRDTFEPGDPARSPSGKLVWFSIVAVVIFLVGLFMAYRVVFAPAAQLPSLVEQQEAQEAAAAQAAADAASDQAPVADPAGEVVFTARGPVWVRFTDAAGQRLMEGEMKQGDTYTLPAGANGPRIITGRPDMLDITIGGRSVEPISREPLTVNNVPVDAASLIARAPQGPPVATAPLGSGGTTGQAVSAQ